MPGVDSNGLQRRNFTGSHNLRKIECRPFCAWCISATRGIVDASSPDLLGDEKITRRNLTLGARSSAKLIRDLGLEPKVVCTCDGVFPASMSVLLELVALILAFAR